MDAEQEKWFISIIDVIVILTQSKDANAYWPELKQILKVEGNETVTNCHGLKMLAQDGKIRITDVADTELKQYEEMVVKDTLFEKHKTLRQAKEKKTKKES